MTSKITSLHSQSWFRVSEIIALLTFTACAPQEEHAESDGVLTEINGELVRLSPEEAKVTCLNQFCEPNYLQSSNFSFRRKIPKTEPLPSPPSSPLPSHSPSPHPTPLPSRVTPSPIPVPVRVPSPSPSPIREPLDYSKVLMNTPEAWKVTRGSSDIIVAVIDSGVDISHPDLKENIWENKREAVGQPGVDDDHNGLIDDIHGYNFYQNSAQTLVETSHGTHVAGILGAAINGVGTVGVSPKVKIMPLTFIGPNGKGSTLDAIRAIQYAIKQGARIISNSWGSSEYSAYLDQALARAHEAGVIVVAAAGNEHSDNDVTPYYPASHSNVISVASSNRNDELSSFSNFGSKSVTLAAPGSSIYSTLPGGEYGMLSGTSMATPQVSGALALALSIDSHLSPDRAKALLCEASENTLKENTQCGRLNIAKLVTSLKWPLTVGMDFKNGQSL